MYQLKVKQKDTRNPAIHSIVGLYVWVVEHASYVFCIHFDMESWEAYKMNLQGTQTAVETV